MRVENTGKPSRHQVRQIKSGQALHLGAHAGEIVVLEGRLWLTRDADLGDHVIEPGQRVDLAAHENAVIEPMFRNEPVLMYWTPHRRSIAVAVLAPALAAVAHLATWAAVGFTVLAAAATRLAIRAGAWRNDRRADAAICPDATAVKIMLGRH